jgi:excisionase family DNA binding protein
MSSRPIAAGEQLYDVAAVAGRLRVSVKTVRRLIGREVLPAHRIGKLLRVSESDLARYIADSRLAGASCSKYPNVSGHSDSQ